MKDKEIEKLIFQGFSGGKTVNMIAKECEPLIEKMPDYRKRGGRLLGYHQLGWSMKVKLNLRRCYDFYFYDQTNRNLL